MALLDNIDNFLQSPGALALASSLLNSTGYSTMPTTFGQAMGNGLMAMQAAKNQDLENQYKKAATQQTQLQNQDLQNKLANKQKLQDLIGAPAKPATAVPYRDIPGTGLLGGQIPQDQARMQMIGLLSQDNPQIALTAFGLNPKVWSKPYSAVGQDGQLHYFQVDNTTGTPREVPGYAPLPKNGMSLTIDPITHQISFTQGGTPQLIPSTDGTLQKDLTKSPARGGQGGTYTDNTGKVISTDTSRQTSLDQQAIAAIERAKPQIEELANTLPQFQTAYMQGLAKAEGIGNKWFGTKYQLPSIQARGEALLKSTPEGLIKAYQLNSTDEMAKMVRAIIEPIQGESADYYKQRVYKSLADLSLFQSQSQQRLAHGTTVVPPNNQVQANASQASSQTQNQPQRFKYNPQTGRLE